MRGGGTTDSRKKLAPNRAPKTNLMQSAFSSKTQTVTATATTATAVTFRAEKSTSSPFHFLPSVNARMLSSSTPRPVSRAVAQSFAHAGWAAGPSVTSFAATLPVFPFCADDGACSTSTTRTTAVPSNTRRILSASQGCTRGDEVEGEDKGEEEEEEPEKACQNALPRRCVSVCDAIDASTACCGVGDDDDAEVEVEPSLGVEGGVGYVGAKEEESMCLPLREAELRMAAVEEK